MKNRRTEKEIVENAGPIAIFVRKKRKELGYTQSILAERSGVGTRFLKELELGKETIRLDKAMQVVEFLGGQLRIEEKE